MHDIEIEPFKVCNSVHKIEIECKYTISLYKIYGKILPYNRMYMFFFFDFSFLQTKHKQSSKWLETFLKENYLNILKTVVLKCFNLKKNIILLSHHMSGANL